MNLISLLAIALALAMDAFAVAIVAGITLDALTPRRLFRLSFHFGLFQALMPVLGWLGGRAIHQYIVHIDHWIAFGLLAFIGGKMIHEAISSGEEVRETSDPTRGMNMVMLSVATSIDALAVGLSLAVIGTDIVFPAVMIGIVACGMTLIGMMLGRRIGRMWGKRVEILGGLILIGIGLKIMMEHLTAG